MSLLPRRDIDTGPHSEQFYDAINSSCSEHVHARVSGAKQLRQAYLDMMTAQETTHVSEPEWWKEVFSEVGKLIAMRAMGILFAEPSAAAPAPPTPTITVAYDGRLFSFDDNVPITIGRLSSCDVVLDPRGTSRLHAIIFRVPAEGSILVVDVGSATGILTLARSATLRPMVCSRPDDRYVLDFGAQETAILTLGTAILAVNAKECVVCLEKPRAGVLGCGHHVVCIECLNAISRCPVCRAPVEIDQPMPSAANMLANTYYQPARDNAAE